MPKDSVKSQGFGSEDVQMPNLVKNNNPNGELADSEEYAKPLTRAEMEALLGPTLLKPSRVTVKGLLILQGLVTIISGLAWWATGSQFGLESSAISAIFGGLIAVVPGILFAVRAKVLSTRANALGSTVFALVTGELLKIIATIAMFILVIKFYPDLDWLPLLLTYVLALKCYWLALILRK
jgi:ATP synthase protein I